MIFKQDAAHNPISEKKRITDIDVVRGFALFMVLLVNVLYFNATFVSYFTGQIPSLNPLQLSFGLNQIIAVFINFFIEGKFYTIFSFLFGLGFYIFISRAEDKGLNSRPLFKRRMLALLAFGLLNLILVWWGDILHVYALGGFILLFFKDKPIQSLKRWVISLLAFSFLVSSLMFTISPLDYQTQAVTPMIPPEMISHAFEVFSSGSYLEIIKLRLLVEIPLILFYNFTFFIPKTLAMFLIGIIAGRLNIFENISGNLKYIHRVWKISGIIGGISLLGTLISGYPVFGVDSIFQNSKIYSVFFELGTVSLSLFYISSLLKMLRKKILDKLLFPFRFVGRMALTNYLVQCIVCSIVFYGHGLGLIGRIDVFTGVVFTVVFFAMQAVFSIYWLRKYRFGPFEYIWRKYTYGRVAISSTTGKKETLSNE